MIETNDNRTNYLIWCQTIQFTMDADSLKWKLNTTATATNFEWTNE